MTLQAGVYLDHTIAQRPIFVVRPVLGPVETFVLLMIPMAEATENHCGGEVSHA